ncbi:MAG: histidine phosphatase family protein [Phycisphaerales bacterium]|nr:histidine phosphatase family protein [Phycisphaerales bacterium]
MKIFLIRHGESVVNSGENYIARVPDHLVSLTEKGIEQANAAGKWLADYCAQNGVPLEHARIWRSPYLRTRQTSEEFNKHLKISDIREDITLVEQQFGLFDSLPEAEWEARFPVEYAECKRHWDNAGNFYLRLPHGESPFDVTLRIHQFMGTIKRDNIHTLFVFTHGVTLRCFLLRWFHYTPEWYANEKNPKNCWIRMIDGKRDMGYIYSS